ncbi:right-handed parallel beta-helix repeat-containing protein [Novosphingobium sp. Chol11]|uniref:right-handed parallel beta-helix repeat-containing protein n=1 Tax=Novosphingobium sp. Chol11 TaxID=1385763 RepID=UPI0025EF4D35|nr:right-handed parallel beta-helix repeat-containing protein [Novosphingobium sp. Chol11]
MRSLKILLSFASFVNITASRHWSRTWVTILVVFAALLALPACAPAQDAALNSGPVADITCKPAAPDQIAAQSQRLAIAADVILAGLRNAQRAGQHAGIRVIEIMPSAMGDDSVTVEAALQQARLIRAETGQPTTLRFAPGRYRLRRTVVLTAADSGTPGAPLRFEAASGGPVILTGGVPLAQRRLPSALDALLSSARRKAIVGYAVPLQIVPSPPFPRQIGTTGYTKSPSLFVFQGDRPIWRSMEPDAGYAVETVAHPQPGPVVAPQVAVPLALAQVRREPSLQAGGYWTFDWAYEENQVAPRADSTAPGGALVLVMPQLKTRYAQAARMRYRLLNGFGFIDRPGEMAFADGTLAVHPWPGSAPVEAAVIDQLVVIDGAHDIAFDGLALQGSRQDIVVISGSRDITISNAYLGLAAGSAVRIKRSDHIVVERSVMTDVGESGVGMDSDARAPSGNILIADNILARTTQLTRAYRAAIALAGHDNVAMGNAISDLPHHAIAFWGTRNLVLGNEISSVVLETADSGAITAYHDLTNAYNTVAQNYLHDIATSRELTQTGPSRQVRDIYLDSWTSFTNVTNNLTDTEAMSYFINSGAKNTVTDNIWFLRGGPSGQIYDYSHHRGDAVGQYVFDDPKTRKLAACSDLPARFDPEFLRDGKPRGNLITGNTNIGGRSVDVPPAFAGMQQIAGERTLAAVPIDRQRGLAGLLDLARQSGAPIGAWLQAADRTAALQRLRYRSRKGR